jgi:hypothetical protein
VSKERAHRRAARAAAAARDRADRERLAARRRRWAALRARTRPHRAVAGRRRETALGRQRSRQNGVLAAAVLAGHTVLWLLASSWWVRGGAVLLTVLAWPLLLVVLFDRRPSV